MASVAVLLVRLPEVITTGADRFDTARRDRAIDLIQPGVARRGARKTDRAVDAADSYRRLLNCVIESVHRRS